MPSFAILPPNIPNVLMSGLADQLLDNQFSYAGYLLLHYPELGVVKPVVIAGLVLVFFPATLAPEARQPSIPAVLTPLTPELASATGFSLEAVLMTKVIGLSTVVFPYQVGPFIVAIGLAGESTRPLLKVTLALCRITVLFLIPLDFLWRKLVGPI